MTRKIQFTNNAASTLASSITNTATSLNVAPGDGSKFPSLTGSQYFMATLVKSDGTTEVIKVTARSTDTLTITRAAEPINGVSTAYAFSAGDRIELRMTAGSLANELDRLDAAALTKVSNKTANYTVTEADISSLIRASTSGGDVTVTLPQISSLTDDFDVIVAKVTSDSNTVTLARSGTDTINGQTSYQLTSQWTSAWAIADRSSGTWTIISSGVGAQVKVDTIAGVGTAGPYTLSSDPGVKSNTTVFVGGVYQQKSSYTLSGTSLTLGGSVSAGVPIEVIYNTAQVIQIGTPTDGSVTTDKIADGGVTAAKMATGAVAAKMSSDAVSPTLPDASVDQNPVTLAQLKKLGALHAYLATTIFFGTAVKFDAALSNLNGYWDSSTKAVTIAVGGFHFISANVALVNGGASAQSVTLTLSFAGNAIDIQTVSVPAGATVVVKLSNWAYGLGSVTITSSVAFSGTFYPVGGFGGSGGAYSTSTKLGIITVPV